MTTDMPSTHWNDAFMSLYMEALSRYHSGLIRWQEMFTPEEVHFLATIGYKEREMFDFIEDYAEEGEPSPTTALLVASVRRDFFLAVQGGKFSESPHVTVGELPSFDDELHGIAYLPRILKKAEAKLYGTLDSDVMFCCGGDRKFLREHGNIHPADFLRMVWGARSDRQKVVNYVLNAIKTD